MTTPKNLVSLVSLALLFALAACTEDPVSPARAINVSAFNLPEIDETVYYELWLSYPATLKREKGSGIEHSDRSYVSVGRFRVRSGQIVGLDGNTAVFELGAGLSPSLVSDALLTIEQVGNTSDEPGARIMAGEFFGSESIGYDTLTLGDGHAFGITIDDTIRRAGSFLLDSPASPELEDFARGIWFGILGLGDSLHRGLMLPPQPLSHDNPEWAYETWLRRQEATGTTWISLGRFENAARADENGAGPGAGANPAAAHGVPGEDFVKAGSERILNDGTYSVVVSMQPFGIPLGRPLLTLLESDPIPTGLGRFQSMAMKRPAQDPYIVVTLDR